MFSSQTGSPMSWPSPTLLTFTANHSVEFSSLLSSLGLPPDYPHYIDSIQAELHSKAMWVHPLFYISRANCIAFLDQFRIDNNFSYGGNLGAAPSKYSVSRANHSSIRPHLGVSGPHGKGRKVFKVAESVRAYRRRLSWGTSVDPPYSAEQSWDHGHCAEAQSLPAVVEQCERLGLVHVEIETYAMDKWGSQARMCKNCEQYVVWRVLQHNPTWVVVDGVSGKRYAWRSCYALGGYQNKTSFHSYVRH
ncbi:hypothetical protein CC2G_002627 [Coprinopsis cinerea AmutBmut pab1-1]|nr:hypothetical protein CC2G_002627 [Coprinopsis cinerea AmutBmut pab1-1]